MAKRPAKARTRKVRTVHKIAAKKPPKAKAPVHKVKTVHKVTHRTTASKKPKVRPHANR